MGRDSNAGAQIARVASFTVSSEQYAQFDRRFFQIDLKGVAAKLSVNGARLDEFVGEYRQALYAFEFYRPTEQPSRKDVERHFVRLEKMTRSLLEALDDANGPVWDHVQGAYEPGTQSVFNVVTGGADGFTYAEYEHDTIQSAASVFLDVICRARRAAMQDRHILAGSTLAYDALVRRLAQIYEKYSSLKPQIDFAFNIKTRTFDGPFVDFVETSLSGSTNSLVLSRNGVGAIIRRILTTG